MEAKASKAKLSGKGVIRDKHGNIKAHIVLTETEKAAKLEKEASKNVSDA